MSVTGCMFGPRYKVVSHIGGGSYGSVTRAIDMNTGKIVAIKSSKVSHQGIPYTTLREVSVLKVLKKCPNVVQLLDILDPRDISNVHLVFECYPQTLHDYLCLHQEPLKYSVMHKLCSQLASAMLFCHERFIFHRDLKPSNIMLTNNLEIKIGDFGLARTMGYPVEPATPEIVTLHYRAPELLLGKTIYDFAVDIWSLGCIFAEFVTLKPLFPGRDQIDQLIQIFSVLGYPTDEATKSLPQYNVIDKSQGFFNCLDSYIPQSHPFHSLISGMLVYEEHERWNMRKMNLEIKRLGQFCS